MNKKEYLDALNETLKDIHVNQKDIDDVLLDYSQMYDDAIDRGLTDEEVYQLLGEPSHVISELRDTLTLKKEMQYRKKIIALSPFIAVIIFMIVGLTTGIYHPTWLIFLIIPMSAIILNSRKKEKIVALSPFIALIIFILLRNITEISDTIWLIFLIIPISSLLFMKNNLKKILYLGAFVIAISFYLYMGYVEDNFRLGLLGFTLPLLVSLVYGEIKFINILTNPNQRREGVLLILIIIFSLITFLLLGFLLNGWAYAWLIFLSIPMASIHLFSKPKKLTPYMPFIAIIIFYISGYFFDLFDISWIAFLLIPIVTVIENN